MFAQLKEKFTDKLRSFAADEDDKEIDALVVRGTDEHLIAPEWSVNLQICDAVNRDPR